MTDPQKVRSEESTHREEQRQETCPECGGQVVGDAMNGETRCGECGLVVDEDEIDRGPEWRAFDATEREQKSRVGPPTTNMLHDKGLSTNIGWQDKDSYGNALSSEQRQKMQRLRTWNERFRTESSKERNLKQALGEIDRMASALGVPDPTRETASVLYQQALSNDLLPGRSIEGIATASLYAATRIDAIPRSIDEVASVSRVDDMRFKRAYRYMTRELGLQIPPTNPIEYLGRLASDLECTDETEQLARELTELAIEDGVHSGKDPVGVAASALYASGQLTNEKITQSTISDVADISEVTIRNRYREVLAAAGETIHG
jgi:transcription initiation factor TFIIB